MSYDYANRDENLGMDLLVRGPCTIGLFPVDLTKPLAGCNSPAGTTNIQPDT